MKNFQMALVVVSILYGSGLLWAKSPDTPNISALRKAAEQGDVKAQSKLGRMYFRGEGVPEDNNEAFIWSRKAAEQGDAVGQRTLAIIYHEGLGVPQNYKEAVSWLRKAVEQGDAGSQFLLGLAYRYGHGVPTDLKTAAASIRKAADQGDADAQYYLGDAYHEGIGVPVDYKQAVAWSRKAAEQGNADGQYHLGHMYSSGKGVPENYSEAAAWYHKAAEQGNTSAQVSLGLSYRDGLGVGENKIEAYKWFALAAADGDKTAVKQIAELRETMSREQVAEAQKRASQWKPGGSSKKTVTASPPIVPRVPAPVKRQISDVDTPSFSLAPNPNNFALVIGIEKYQKLPAAQFAEHDAATMRKYFLGMGFPERNIIYLNGENATRARLSSYLDEWLPKNVSAESTVFFYFSGHGAPNAENKQAYLMPWDGDAQFLKSTAYPLNQLYESINHLKAKKKIVILDACFSGSGGRSVLAMGTRPLVPKVATHDGLGGVILFAATSEDEVTGTLDEQGHGIFTYYLLKGLSGKAKDSSGAVTAKGLHLYLKPFVQDAARRQNREQTPTLGGALQDVEVANFK